MEYLPSKKFLRRRYEKRKRGYFKTFMGKNSTFERFLGSTISPPKISLFFHTFQDWKWVFYERALRKKNSQHKLQTALKGC